MSQQDLSHYIPRRLDDKSKFLFWDLDVAGVALIGMLLGVATEYRVLGLVGGILMAYGYSRLKAGRHPGMAAHLLYWFTGMPSPKELPKSHIRELNG
jgi:conjugal transfer pilus assembly protein TraL